jgi:hypothetical protein
MDVSAALHCGVELLAPALTPHGFRFEFRETGKGSGGAFAWGEFVRGDRRLQLHFRHALGMVTYHLDDLVLAHEDFMRAVLGTAGGNAYPGFSDDPLDGFRHLRHDLERYAGSFLSGSDAEFRALVERARSEPAPRGLKALSQSKAV